MEIYDGEVRSAERLLYDSDGQHHLTDAGPDSHHASRKLLVGGRSWALEIYSLSGFRAPSTLANILLIGTLGSLMLSILAWSLLHGRRLALRQAKRMSHDLQDSERYHLELLTHLPAAVLVQGTDADVRYANAEACRLFGIDAEEIRGKTAASFPWRLLRGDGSPMDPADYPLNRVLATRTTLHDHVVGIQREGMPATLWLQANAFPHMDGDGQCDEVVTAFLDVSSLRAAQEALRKSLAELDELYHLAPCGYHSLDEEGRIVRINKTEAAWLGYRQDELLGRHYSELLSPASLGVFRESYARFLQQGYIYDLELELVRRNGLPLIGALSVTANCEGKGRPTMHRSTLHDISERKRAENELRQARAKLQQIVDVSPIAIYHVQLDQIGAQPPLVTFMSRQVSQLTGYAQSDWQTPGFWEAHVHPDDRQAVLDAQQTLFADGRLQHEYRFLHHDGSALWIDDRLVVLRDDSGQPMELVGTWMDITQRKQTEQALQILNRLYALLSRANQAIVHIHDLDRLLEEICRVAVEEGGLLMAWAGRIQDGAVKPYAHWGHEDGYLEKALILVEERGLNSGPTGSAIREGRHVVCDDIANDPNMAPWRDLALARGYRSSAAFPIRVNQVVVGTINFYAPTPRYFSPAMIELLSDLGADVSFAMNAHAETRRRQQAEEELVKLNEQLEQRVLQRTRELEVANQELESFSYSVSHDLRAPLRGIDGFSQILLKRYADRLDDTGRDYLGRVRRASQRMGELIDDLLNLSRMSRSPLRRQEVDLSSVAELSLQELRRGTPERTVDVRVQPAMHTFGDPGLLRVVLDNLLGNAWKFTRHADPAKIEFGNMELNGEMVYFVRDNGAGYDKTYARKLFQVFQRLHSESEFEGTGIGLATVQRIILRHHGKVWAEGDSGKGACFFFTLPRRARPRNDEPTDEPEAQS